VPPPTPTGGFWEDGWPAFAMRDTTVTWPVFHCTSAWRSGLYTGAQVRRASDVAPSRACIEWFALPIVAFSRIVGVGEATSAAALDLPPDGGGLTRLRSAYAE
jgi:hypothetical protein